MATGPATVIHREYRERPAMWRLEESMLRGFFKRLLAIFSKSSKSKRGPWATAQAHVQHLEASRLAALEARERKWEVKRRALRAQERDSRLLFTLAAGNALFATLFTLSKCGVL